MLSFFFYPSLVKQIIGIQIRYCDQDDRYVWGPSSTGKYSIKFSTWLQINEKSKHDQIALITNQMWKLNILPKIKFFAWLLLRKRLKTRDRLSIFDYIDDNSCPLCDSDSETASHLFGYCPLNPEVWNLSGFNTNIDWSTRYLQVF